MTQKDYTVEGRQFRTGTDYARALRDKRTIDELRSKTNMGNRAALEKLQTELKEGKYPFYTLLGDDFKEEVEEALRSPVRSSKKEKHGKAGGLGGKRNGTEKRPAGSEKKKTSREGPGSAEMDAIVQEELKRQEKRRKLTILACSIVAAGCLGYFGIYSWYQYRTGNNYDKLSDLKGSKPITDQVEPVRTANPLYTLDATPEPKEVLDEYKNLLIKYKKLIGWLTFDDKTIGGESGFPVMQTTDNEYYLRHNMDQEYDKNGTIFMDKDCDVLKPSTNFIVYGHHMKSGRMFGKLDLYEDQEYCEIVFKYYQFIDANSEQEFDSYMEEMASMSLYDTGVTAQYGDQLLTLSTCDYQEKDGRFVVVAKKIKE